MKCRKCKTEIPNNSRFCLQCGAKQNPERQPKSRGNGTGTVFKRGTSWTAQITTGYSNIDGAVKRHTRSKGGFRTKKDAVNYLSVLRHAPVDKVKAISFCKVYEQWLPTHQASASTLGCYRAAYKYFAPVYDMKISDISVDDLQDCLDECTKGKRTKENMKALCGLMYKYSIPRHYLYDNLNMGQFLKVTGESGTKDGLPVEALDAIAKHVGSVFGADYVLCQCYLGFRPAEFIALDAAAYDRKEKAFVGGSKTAAGANRTVTISPKIQPYIDKLMKDKIGGAVFTDSDGLPLSMKKYRQLFYEVLEKSGVDNPVKNVDDVEYHKYTPHSCRHTFATLMKRVEGADKDKLELIGHTSTEMLRHYQDVAFDDLRKITNAL